MARLPEDREFKSEWRLPLRCDLKGPDPPKWITHKDDLKEIRIGEPRSARALKPRATAMLKAWQASPSGNKLVPAIELTGNARLLSSLVHSEKYDQSGEMSHFLTKLVLEGSLAEGSSLVTQVGSHMTVEMRHGGKYSTWYYSRHTPGQAVTAIAGRTAVDPTPEEGFWRSVAGSYMLAFPRLFFNVPAPRGRTAGRVKDWTLIECTEWQESARRLLDYHRMLVEYSVDEYQYLREQEAVRVILRFRSTLVPYLRGRECFCLPVPGKPPELQGGASEPWAVKSQEVVVSSPRVSAALESLSRIWEDRSANSVLLSAPPGSGKEVFALSIPYGTGRDPARIQTVSLGAANQEELERQLFGWKRDDGTIADGFIKRAVGSALFVDEAHRPDDSEGLRGSLLRPLEAGDYLPLQTSDPQRVGDVLFVFAASLPLHRPAGRSRRRPRRGLQRDENRRAECLEDIRPQDFWTRMTHVLEIKHPLNLAESRWVRDRRRLRGGSPVGQAGEAEVDSEPLIELETQIIEDLFAFFWWDRAEKYYKVRIGLQDVSTAVDDGDHASARSAELLRRRHLRTLLKEMSARAQQFARLLLECMQEQGCKPHELSVRGIRSIVSRVFSIVVTDITKGQLRGRVAEYDGDVKGAIKDIMGIATLNVGAE